MDLCVASRQLVKSLSDFSVVQHGDLPSDHVRVTVTVNVKGIDLDSTLTPGDHATLYGPANKIKLVIKPLS